MRLLDRRTRLLDRTGLLVGAALALAAILVIPMLPTVRRYARMKRM